MRTLSRSRPAHRLLLIAAGLALAVTGGVAHAAEQGAIGAASRGSVSISASVAVHTVFSDASDVADSDASATQSICFWSNGATRGFGLAAAGDAPDGALSVADGTGHTVRYDVDWGGAALAAGSQRLGLTATANQLGCGKDQTGRTRLTITFARPASHASGALSLLVIPQ